MLEDSQTAIVFSGLLVGGGGHARGKHDGQTAVPMPVLKMPSAEMLYFLLFASHYLADFPLQGTFLATAKSRHSELGRSIWPHALFGHAIIHGSGVALVTGSVTLGIAEVIIHAMTDFSKCEGWIDFNVDQAIHLVCKLAWGYLALHGLS